MTLVVQGNQDLKTLEKWVKESFSEIKNKEVELPKLDDPLPWQQENLGKLIAF